MLVQKIVIILMYLFFNTSILATQDEICITIHNNNKNNYSITAHFTVKDFDFIYQDYLTVSIDSPTVILSDCHTSINPVSQYDPLFKQTKKIYNQSFDMTINAHIENFDTNTHLHIAYYKNSHKKITHITIPLIIGDSICTPDPEITNEINTNHEINQATFAHATPPKKYFWQQHLYLAFICMQSPWFYILFILCIGAIACILLFKYIRASNISLNARILLLSIGACIYGSIIIAPWHVASWLLATLISGTSILCMYKTKISKQENKIKFYFAKTFCCILATMLSVFLYAKASQAIYIYKQKQLTFKKYTNKKSLKQLSKKSL